MKKILLLLVLCFAPSLVNAQAWQFTGSMNVVHWDAGMIVLDNNTVLIAGGLDPNVNPIATCEIYDPTTASWTLTGSLNVARGYACLIKLSNGHVLAISGSTETPSGGPSDAVEDYNPAAGTWTLVGHLQIARMVPTANMLNTGKILIAGGLTNDGTTSSCELYDPSTNTSTMTGSMALNRYEHQSSLLNDGRVMINGGRDGGAGSDYFSETELYDPATGTWLATNSMAQSRMEAITTTFSDGSILAAGGRNAPASSAPGSEIFDVNTLSWSSTSPLKEPVCWMGCIQFPDNRYMVTGGIITGTWIDLLGLDNVTTPKCEWYDRNLQLWYYAPELNLSRCRHKAIYLHQTGNVNLPEDFLLVAGGQTGTAQTDSNGNLTNFQTSFTNTAEVLDVSQPALKTYMKLPSNAGTAGVYASNNDPSFKCFYQPDGSIKIEYTLTNYANVSVSIVNSNGQLVNQLPAENLSAGSHTLNVATSNLASGMYFIRFNASDGLKSFKFFVAK